MTGEGSDGTEGLATFLVEHYWPGVQADMFEASAERVRASAEELAAGGVGIRFLHSTLVLDDEAAFCVFEADSRATVEEAYARAGVGFDRLRDALQIATDGTVDDVSEPTPAQAGSGREEP